ncbi:SDR family oxidoreductase [Aquibacillus salsiterrae]|uniref:SDR family oxidoreductase n=1 Tax=Aquibacillus salsiterrae TaxID=2950439 RepID=A0A9X3WD00_9BACI|nr:SDR family oxidoreductase [Aquibacillus salsiterrae]MDC3416698.1 SDR family oxidoreductase [Aquibacillus salsiterrae]
MGSILVLGANSTIAQATVRKLTDKGKHFILTSRDPSQLEDLKNDINIRSQVDVQVREFDALDFAGHKAFFDDVVGSVDVLDGVLLMYGAMDDQKLAEHDFAVARNMIDVNYTSAVSMLNIAANYFEQRGAGFICAVSSVAGDRGRKSNYIYGSTKAGLSVYLQGLRNRLHRAGVHVITIKPGMVDTKMTYGLVEPGPLLADPVTVGRDIANGITARREVVYTPWFWLIIMGIIKLIPEKIFKRTDL